MALSFDELKRAKCRGMDPEFFMTGGLSTVRKFCAGCPIQKACLYDALEIEEAAMANDTTAGRPWGIRAGVSAASRTKILKERAARAEEQGKSGRQAA